MLKYIHIERLGTDEVDGILNGTVYIMPKLDGTNGQIYFHTDEVINELKIAREYITKGRLDKVKAKILTEKETGWNSKYIGEYLGRVFNEIILEEMWNILKQYKNPKIDFKSFNQFDIQVIKEIDRETFGG